MIKTGQFVILRVVGMSDENYRSFFLLPCTQNNFKIIIDKTKGEFYAKDDYSKIILSAREQKNIDTLATQKYS